ncbi:MAG: 4-(cytidine 5'-diphospho)-2-C-methyl-D-erythritol kinase [Bacteroidales bacterium]|nr:4-(cytidine 5'-diphospho)-2-C-methyl-D-erythritol kinase [Bacteroidales bacterium]
MICFPNCKINLGLSITEKKPDGFHNIETVFYPVNLCDALEVSTSKNYKTVFIVDGLDISGNINENLCLKAFNILKKHFDIPEVNFHLIKNIPMGAGLGGGSSDAAFTIKILNDLFSLKMPDGLMIKYAKILGSDCAFFIKNKAVFASGKGDKFKNINLDISNYQIAIIKPKIHISTQQAYSNIIPSKKNISVKEIIKMPVSDWKKNLFNDFEKPIFEIFPEIEKIKNKLYNLGAEYASMSGSGSAVYGLFKNEIELQSHFTDCFVWHGK